MRGLAQWLEAGRDPAFFWHSALVAGLSASGRTRLLHARKSPLLATLVDAGFLTRSSLAVAESGLQHGRLPAALRLIAYAEQQQDDARTAWTTGLAAPLIVSAVLLGLGEFPVFLAGMSSAMALIPPIVLGGLGVFIVALSQARDSALPVDVVFRQALRFVPGFAQAFQWRAEASVLEVLHWGASQELPAPLVLGAADLAGDHPLIAPLFERARRQPEGLAVPSLVFAPWFGRRDAATVAHATDLGRLPEVLPDLKERRTRWVPFVQRATSWGIVGLTIAVSTVVSVVRIANAWLQYATDLGVPM